jgi:hypothetical protein
MLALVAAALLSAAVSSPAMADGGHGGGNSGSGGGGSGSGGGGGDDGGHSGHGGGDDGGDDGGNSGPGGGGDKNDDDEGQRSARDARKQGQASSLREVLGSVRRRYKGKVVDVKFAGKRKSPTYRIKLIDDRGRLITVSVDALTQRILKVSGL